MAQSIFDLFPHFKMTSPSLERMRMNRFRSSIALLFAVILVACSTLTAGSSAKTEDDFQIVKVSEGVYAGIAKPGGFGGGNAGFIVGDGGVLMVDTFTAPVAVQEIISEIGKVTQQPIRFAVNTHYHLDHTGGNQVLAERGVPIIAHDNVAKWQTVKNRRFLPPSEELQKRKADLQKQITGLG